MKTKKSKMTFEEKVRSMTAGEIIMAMIDDIVKRLKIVFYDMDRSHNRKYDVGHLRINHLKLI